MRKLLLLTVLSFLLIYQGFSQQRTCASYELLLQQMADDPVFAARIRNAEKNFDSYKRRTGPLSPDARQTVLTIPVVVHVVYNNAAQNISDAQVQSQVDVLNEDFTASNRDYNNYNAGYAGVRGDPAIRFCLVQVIHKATKKKSFSSNDGVKKSKQGGSDAVDPQHKLNLWVCNLGQNLLGYAQFPGGPAATFGVVCHYLAFGRGSQYNLFSLYNLGRTTTHEIGHCLGLRHIWGDATCGNDFVGDTPLHNTANFGCPGEGHRSTCAGTPLEMWMNYMDYTDDRCMYFFSDGQVARSSFYIDTDPQLQSIVNSTCTLGATSNTIVTNTSGGSNSGRLSNPYLLVYPTITAGSVTVQFDAGINGKAEVNIYNTTGSLVYRNTIAAVKGDNVKQVDVSRLANGIYILQLNQNNDKKVVKLIVQH
jgi:type IX secretion system substrate protein/pregnancy-associated plasma protein-A